jgi:hypothetical protein
MHGVDDRARQSITGRQRARRPDAERDCSPSAEIIVVDLAEKLMPPPG